MSNPIYFEVYRKIVSDVIPQDSRRIKYRRKCQNTAFLR